MNAKQTREDAIRATRGQIRFVGSNPATANEFDIESACSEARPEFARDASENQWKMFMREFKKWQKGQ